MTALLERRCDLVQERVELLRLNGHYECVTAGDGTDVVRPCHEPSLFQVVELLGLTPRDLDVGRRATTGPDPPEGECATEVSAPENGKPIRGQCAAASSRSARTFLATSLGAGSYPEILRVW